jgi:Dna[CI] antecedent, DciA
MWLDGSVTDEPMAITDSLTSVVRGLRPDPAGGSSAAKGPSARQLGGVFGRWEEAVGTAVAAHVRPLRLDGEVLVVEVDDPGWATQLRLLETTMRDRLAEVVGLTVARIDVRVAGARRRR